MSEFYEEKFVVAEAMIQHGGSFVEQLGQMLKHADLINARKIKQTWPDYWAQYLKIAREKNQK